MLQTKQTSVGNNYNFLDGRRDDVRQYVHSDRGRIIVNGTVAYYGAPPVGTIDLGIGQPSADLLPVDRFRQASESFYLGEGYNATEAGLGNFALDALSYPT